MTIRGFMLLTLPLLANAQAPAPKYVDSLFAPGADEGAPPLTPGEKFGIRVQRTVAPRVFITNLFVAGIQQAENTPGKWGRGWDGFGKRYGTDLAINGISEVVAAGLDQVTHEDPRFFRSQHTGVAARFKDAVLQVLIAHTDSGGRMFNFGTVIGDYAGAQAAALWLPHSAGTPGDGAIYGTILLGADAGVNVFREFWPDVRRKLRRH